jgi:hypothetical protein
MQFSLFGAAVAEPALDDLAGVVFAGGDWVRSAADGAAADGATAVATARLSVVVDARWRAAALVSAFAELDVGASLAPAESGTAVRTDFSARLAPEAQRWTRGAVLYPPTGLVLPARGLRLWAIAAGRADAGGYLLATIDPDHQIHRSGGAQLARLGVAAIAITVKAGSGWRVTSVKRLRRLAELLGESPEGAGLDWPA